MYKVRLLAVIVILLIGIGGVIFASNYYSHQNQEIDYNAVLLQARSGNWQQRAIAVQQLAKPTALYSTQAREILLELLERENQIIEDTLRESGGKDGVSSKYGEDYSEYYSTQLLALVEKVANYGDKHTLEVLASSAYAPDSPFAQKLVTYGEPVLSILIGRTKHDVSTFRASSIELLGQIVKNPPEPLDAETKNSIKQSLLNGINDPDVMVQLQAVIALGDVGDKDDIPILEKLVKLGPISADEADKKFLQKKAIEAINAISKKGSSKH